MHCSRGNDVRHAAQMQKRSISRSSSGNRRKAPTTRPSRRLFARCSRRLSTMESHRTVLDLASSCTHVGSICCPSEEGRPFARLRRCLRRSLASRMRLPSSMSACGTIRSPATRHLTMIIRRTVRLYPTCGAAPRRSSARLFSAQLAANTVARGDSTALCGRRRVPPQ